MSYLDRDTAIAVAQARADEYGVIHWVWLSDEHTWNIGVSAHVGRSRILIRPSTDHQSEDDPFPQRTLRDEFAMAALQILPTTLTGYPDYADFAYRMADAMMERRKR